ncbi:glycine cleavage system protein GcvH [Desulfovermiculus halophilus]|uniref:glycine cleavage system protein GcvH n=1 Tax=Desulfovermiculus halophilus TaxID=339722 RepID=UPI0006848DBC|nr:glycine cleavage system protein GcvH [Desulfovermiculus halophilus]
MGDQKTFDDLIFLDDRGYHSEHTWAKIDGDTVLVGISDFAQDSLGEIIFIDLPEAGSTFDQGEEFGLAESAKVASPLYMPVAGEVVAANEQLEDDPTIVNQDPYEQGWMVRVKAQDTAQVQSLMSAGEYKQMVKDA